MRLELFEKFSEISTILGVSLRIEKLTTNIYRITWNKKIHIKDMPAELTISIAFHENQLDEIYLRFSYRIRAYRGQSFDSLVNSSLDVVADKARYILEKALEWEGNIESLCDHFCEKYGGS